jgi:hypothetical protein
METRWREPGDGKRGSGGGRWSEKEARLVGRSGAEIKSGISCDVIDVPDYSSPRVDAPTPARATAPLDDAVSTAPVRSAGTPTEAMAAIC